MTPSKTTSKAAPKKSNKEAAVTVEHEPKTTSKTASKSKTEAPDPKLLERLISQETFTVSEMAPQKIPDGSIQLLINGTDKGVVSTDGANLGTFASNKAKAAGIKAYSVYLTTGTTTGKANSNMLLMSLNTVSKIEIVSKDSRGLLD